MIYTHTNWPQIVRRFSPTQKDGNKCVHKERRRGKNPDSEKELKRASPNDCRRGVPPDQTRRPNKRANDEKVVLLQK